MTMDEALKVALATLKQVMEEKLSSSNVEVSTQHAKKIKKKKKKN